MRRFAMSLALRLSGWFAEKLFDLACAIEAMDSPSKEQAALPVEGPSVPIVARLVPQSIRTPHGYACSTCGKTTTLGTCRCGLSDDALSRWSRASAGDC